MVDCKWTGMVAPRGEGHALTVDGGQNLCIARSVFDGCDRGPVFTDTTRAVKGVLVTDIDLRNINRVDNGNELILLESRLRSTYMDMIFHRGRVTGCSGDINLWNANTVGVVFNDWILNDASIYSPGYGSQLRTTITNCEFRGGGVYFAGGAVNASITNCAFLNWRLTRVNQVYSAPYLYDASAPRPAYRPLPVATGPIYAQTATNRPATTNVVTKGGPEVMT
jgi:hypothetical protein